MIRLMQRVIPVVVSASLLLGGTGGAALAASPAESSSLKGVDVRCSNSVCTLEAGLDGVSPLARAGARLGIAALQDKVDALAEGASVRIDDNLVLTLPVGKLTLPKAQVALELGDDRRIERLHGTAEVPFPTFGVLSDVTLVQPALAEVGLDSGANLAHLGAPLDAERQYLFFNINSGFDVSAQVEATGEAFRLAVPAGQRATLVIDTEQPLVYLAGNLVLNQPGQVALAGPLQDLAQSSALIPDALPVRERTGVAVTGVLGKDAENYLTLSGAYAVDAGALGHRLGVEIEPLAVQGVATVSREGLSLTGAVSSQVAPETVFDGKVEVDAFVPFQGSIKEAFVQVKGAASVPAAGLAADANARLDLRQGVTAAAHATTPLTASRFNAGQGDDANAVAAHGQSWLAAAGRRAAAGATALGNLASRAGHWLSQLPADGQATIAKLGQGN